MTTLLDPRAPRFAAGVTSVVLVLALVFSLGWLVLAQAVVFAISAFRPKYSPYNITYRCPHPAPDGAGANRGRDGG